MTKKVQSFTCKLADNILFGKILLAISCFAVFLAIFRLEVAVLVFLGLLIHEYGHAIAAKQMFVPVRGVYLFPWLGGLCVYKTRINDWQIGNHITFMGPAFRLMLSTVLFLFGAVQENDILLFGACINAFEEFYNLIPIGKRNKDGRKLLEAITAPSSKSGLSFEKRFCMFLALSTLLLVSATVVYWSFRMHFADVERFFQPYLAEMIRIGARFIRHLFS